MPPQPACWSIPASVADAAPVAHLLQIQLPQRSHFIASSSITLGILFALAPIMSLKRSPREPCFICDSGIDWPHDEQVGIASSPSVGFQGYPGRASAASPARAGSSLVAMITRLWFVGPNSLC